MDPRTYQGNIVLYRRQEHIKGTSYYIVGPLISALKIYKLPKNSAVLSQKSMCLDIAKEVCDMWKHLFELILVCGKESMGYKRVDNNVKLQYIAGKIQRLYHEWKDLENAYKKT